jgi:hypothetical protein
MTNAGSKDGQTLAIQQDQLLNRKVRSLGPSFGHQICLLYVLKSGGHGDWSVPRSNLSEVRYQRTHGRRHHLTNGTSRVTVETFDAPA